MIANGQREIDNIAHRENLLIRLAGLIRSGKVFKKIGTN
jgi:hypothetical protein